MKTIWYFLLFFGFYSNKVALGTKISCFVRYYNHRQQCTISEIATEGINQQIDLPILINGTQTIPFSENTLDSILSNLFKTLPELAYLHIDTHKDHPTLDDAKSMDEALKAMSVSTIGTLENNSNETSSEEINIAPINLDVFKQTNNLTSLIIHAPLGTIPKEIFSSTNSLEFVHFSKCNITEIEDFAFANGKQLIELYLNRNSITELRQNTFAGLSNLKDLNLQHNQISRIEEGALNLPKLTVLDLGDNQLVTLSDTVFSLLPSLKHIELNSNKFEYIGKSLYSLQKIVNVHLKHNQIVDIDLKEFAKLPTLDRLQLSNSGFDWTTQANLTDDFITSANFVLDILDVSNNNIKDSSFINKLKIFRKLAFLVVDENPFEEITWTAASIHEVLPGLRRISANKVKLNCEHLENLRKELEIGGIIFQYPKSDCTV